MKVHCRFGILCKILVKLLPHTYTSGASAKLAVCHVGQESYVQHVKL